MDYFCPAKICDAFALASEEEKGVLRQRAIDWMASIWPYCKVGDRVFIPNPETGELMDHTFTGDRARL